MGLKVIILAAGKGTRMRSALPKVLQPLGAKPLLSHVVNTAHQLQAEQIVAVVGHQAEMVTACVRHQAVTTIPQTQQLGTGHAVLQATDVINDNDTVLVLYGDVPLTKATTLTDLIDTVSDVAPLALLTINLDNPAGYGRIVRNSHHAVEAIVEQKEATPEQLKIAEVNTGMLAARGSFLKDWLGQLSNQNAQGEYYLTDIIAMCVQQGFAVQTTQPSDELEVLGVNDKVQLQQLERRFQLAQALTLMNQGATIVDASRLEIRGDITIGQDVQIDVNVIFEGTVHLGNNVKIGAHCILKDVSIDDDSIVHPFSHLDTCQIGKQVAIGPYARLRPGTELADEVRIGNFVETKQASIGQGSKINHLSYIGNTQMGEECNIGAGTITCNYDGVNKHLTQIGNKVFVGSDTQLIAPVQVADQATIGAGSTITKAVPGNTLTLSRSKQITINSWQKPKKSDLD